ncbi:RNA polymerase sigma factor [Streptomyces bluensis]|uniref:RNA polymerase sigma factor n=1 Tax=Streptomyces bluensis TaxID=33897 RepID=UPI00332BEC5F
MSEAGRGVGLTLGEVHACYYGEMVGSARNALREAGVPESHIGAEDIVQNAFAKAYRDPGRIRQPRAYLYTVIRREVQEQAARARRARAHTYTDVPVPAPDCGDMVVEVCDVRRALSSLPVQQRAAVWATKAVDWSQAEYAQRVGKHPGTVATHVSRAVAVLKTKLAVATVVAAVALSSAGTATIRRHSAASRPGPSFPDLPDLNADHLYVVLASALTAFAVLPLLSRAWYLLRRSRTAPPKRR